jgi:hypothetical protein
MYRSTSYASQGSKTVFVEMAGASAETARLLREARAARPAKLPERLPSLVRWAASKAGHLLEGLSERIAQRPVEARG